MGADSLGYRTKESLTKGIADNVGTAALINTLGVQQALQVKSLPLGETAHGLKCDWLCSIDPIGCIDKTSQA